jgi:D-methionine transport system substrate-binding protein
MMRRRDLTVSAALAALAGLSMSAPASATSLATTSGAAGTAVVRIAVAPGQLNDVFAKVRELALPRGLDLRIDTRADTHGVDVQLERGILDAAAFENGIAFADELRRRPGRLVVAAATVTLPIALYSRRLTTPRQLRDGDTVAVPRDASDLARALVLLQNFGLIVLRDDVGLHATLPDIVGNPRRLRVVALPEERLYGALTTTPVVVMDSTSAIHAGLQPARDSIGIEDARTPFAGVLVVRQDRLSEPWVARLIAVLHGEDMKRYLLERFHDSVRRPW